MRKNVDPHILFQKNRRKMRIMQSHGKKYPPHRGPCCRVARAQLPDLVGGQRPRSGGRGQQGARHVYAGGSCGGWGWQRPVMTTVAMTTEGEVCGGGKLGPTDWFRTCRVCVFRSPTETRTSVKGLRGDTETSIQCH